VSYKAVAMMAAARSQNRLRGDIGGAGGAMAGTGVIAAVFIGFSFGVLDCAPQVVEHAGRRGAGRRGRL
jgi:hypothetical protein